MQHLRLSVTASVMGCGPSEFADVYGRKGVHEHRFLFEGLSFKEMDIARLHKVYRKIDNDNSGEIELAELLAYLDLEKTRFTKRIFSIFDEDNSGLIDFREFVLSLWNYCTLTRASLTMFAFDLYDKDCSGNISAEEVVDMLHDLYGKEFKKNPHACLVEKELEAMEALDGDVNIEDFREFSRTHPALLFNAFRMQEAIQERVLGPVFWSYYSERRIEVSRGRLYIPVSEFIELHINSAMKQAVVDKNFGLGNKLNEADVGYVADPRFEGKITDRAVDLMTSTGSMARRKGKESIVKAARSRRRASTVAPADAMDSVEAQSKSGLIDNDRSFESKMEEIREKYEDRQITRDQAQAMSRDAATALKVSKKVKSGRRSFDNADYSGGKVFGGNHPGEKKFQDNSHLPPSVVAAIGMSDKGQKARRGSVAVTKFKSGKQARKTFDQ